MKKLCLILTTSAFFATSAFANPPLPPPPKPIVPSGGGGGGGAGASAVGGFIAFVAVLAGYDAVRRWTCIGDPFKMGGPGFSSPMPATGNVKAPPNCGKPAPKKVTAKLK